MAIYGYIRVSSQDQKEDRQLIAMREASVPQCNIYVDKQSGKDFKRPMYKKMIRRLKCCDLIYIKSIDRLGRNYKDVVEPPAPPKLLTHLLDINTWHKSCVEAIASDASGAGYTLIPNPEVEEPMMEQKQRITEFFESLRPNINKLLYLREYDAESVGYGLLEIVREAGDRDAPICDIKHYPAHTAPDH